jgi:hypothetical protein
VCGNACAIGSCSLGACSYAFPYVPSNFNPASAALNPGATNATTSFDCTTTTFNSTTGQFTFVGTCPGFVAPTPVAITQSGGPDAVVLAFQDIVIPSGSTFKVEGNKPVIIAVYGDATITGTLSASASGATAGAGGSQLCTGASGTNGGDDTNSDEGASGAGGGAFATAGANGGDGRNNTNGVGGAAIGNDTLIPLRGGCPGGSGGKGTSGSTAPAGGAGGGGVQLSVAGTLSVTGVIAAAGGGGQKGTSEEDGGGGGGSGGGILLEGDSVSIATGAWVTANGGGGGAGNPHNGTGSTAGANGGASTTAQATGGTGSGTGGDGGKGAAAAGSATVGSDRGTTALGCGFLGLGACYGAGGGGGGGTGRIRINASSTCSMSGNTSGSFTGTSSCIPSVPPDTTCSSLTYNSRSYWFCTNTRSWKTARDNCMNQGYNLVTIGDSAENSFVDTNLAGSGWIGFTDQNTPDKYSTEGTFKWQSGRAIPYTNWNGGEPNDSGGNEDCTELGDGGGWNDVSCTATRAYVCEQNDVTNTATVSENAAATATCTSGTIQGWTSMYGYAGGGTCPTSCGTCTLGQTSCSVTFNNTNCGDCNSGTGKPGQIRLSCQ